MARPSKSKPQGVPLRTLPSRTQGRSSRPAPESPPDQDLGSPSSPGPSRPPPSSQQNPLAHLKARLSRFAPGTDAAAPSDSGSDYELLLDPNLPADYSQRHQALPRHSLSAVEDAAKTSIDSDRAPLVPGGVDDGSDDGDDEEEEEVEDSPYPEVRAAVHPYDDHSLPCNTLRAWSIGLSLIFLGASMNTLFSLRSPNISLGPLIAQVIAWYILPHPVEIAVP